MIKYLLLGFLFIIGNLNAQTIITDRPDQTESSSTVIKGSLQIESGMLLGFSEDKNETERQVLAPTTLFRIGITNGIEIRILNQFESIKNQKNLKEVNGISDIEVGAKVQLFQKDDKNSEMAFLSHLIIPTGTTGLSNDEYGTINKLSIAHSINEAIGIGYNFGYNYFGTGNGDLTYSLALGFGITEKASVYIEPYGDITEFDDHIANLDAGVTYLIKENLQLDFSFGTGINYTMNYTSVGLSWNISSDK